MQLGLSEILSVTGGELIAGNPSTVVKTFSTDTRNLKNGDFFIGLKGENFDGGKFSHQALAKDAIGIMVSEMPPELSVPRGKCCVRVKDTLAALGDLAAFWRKKINPVTLAVMGSSGKTTTKDMIAHMGSSHFNMVSTKENFNNTIGVPLTIFEVKESTELLAVELGMNMPGEMSRLSRITNPDFLVLTNIGRAHLGMFGSREKLIKAKAEVFDYLKPDCTLIINADCAFTPSFLSYKKFDHPRITFGIDNNADLMAANPRCVRKDCYEFELVRQGEKIGTVRVPLFGRYNIYNALGAISALYAAGTGLENITDGLIDFTPAKMRSEILLVDGVTIVSDCYNSNPDAVALALASLHETRKNGKIFVVLGDMLELGDDAERIHREVGSLFAKWGVDILITYGEMSVFIGSEAQKHRQETRHFKTHESIAVFLSDQASPGDTVLIKGSRLMKLENVSRKLIELKTSNVLVKQG